MADLRCKGVLVCGDDFLEEVVWMCDRGKRGIRGGGGAMEIGLRVKLATEVFHRYDGQIRAMIAFLVEDEELREDVFHAVGRFLHTSKAMRRQGLICRKPLSAMFLTIRGKK